MGLGICISNKFPGDTDTGLGTTLFFFFFLMFLLYFIFKFIFVCVGSLLLRAGLLLVTASGGCSSLRCVGLLIAVASLVAEHGL